MTIPVLIAMLAALIGALLVYAGARNQRLTRGRRRPFLWAGWGLLALVLAVMLALLSIPAAVFIWMTLLMLVWSTVPLAIALWNRRREAAR